MTLTASLQFTAPGRAGRPQLDIGEALDLLRAAVDAGAPSIVEHALLEVNVTAGQLESMRGHRLRDLYRDAKLPVGLSLGALIVFDAAQQSESRGSRGDDVLDSATAAAGRFLDLVAFLPRVHPLFDQCAGGCKVSPL